MVLLRHLGGPAAGQETVARRLPFRIGRGTGDDLRIEAPGVWETHLVIERAPERRLQLRTREGASAFVNGAPVQVAPLRNGDVIEAGGVRLQFWLSPVRQAGLRLREALTWVGLGLLTAFQIFVAWNLTR
jgi:pSer/pThr/pTyr-binding forkhead associated (FHA) protein